MATIRISCVWVVVGFSFIRASAARRESERGQDRESVNKHPAIMEVF